MAREKARWTHPAATALLGLAVLGTAWLAVERPASFAQELDADPMARQETQATVDIKEEPAYQAREWWPTNSKLLMGAKHGIKAEGLPKHTNATYTWWEENGEGAFNPNNSSNGFTTFTAPKQTGVKTIHVRYNHLNNPEDQEPLDITRPRYVSPLLRSTTSRSTRRTTWTRMTCCL